MQLEQQDTTAALTTINKGRQKYPEDNNLIIQGLNIYLQSGRDKEAYDQLDAAIAKDPGNSNLYFAKGTLSDKLGKGDDAAASYKKAIELKPDFFDSNYNLGAMYFNQAADLANKANNIPASKMAEYESAKKKYEAKFKEAQPYLEKAFQINPKDEATIQSLRQLYGRIGDMQKAAEMKKALEAIGK
jgi:tetratricopeptide (TPR) repeat protein